MRNWKRLFYYLFINVLVSACATVTVLTIWDRVRAPDVPTVEPVAQNLTALTPGASAANPPGSAPVNQNPEPAGAEVAATPTEEPSAGPSFKKIEYAVQAGDTLGKIADRFDITIEDILAENELDDPNRLEVGQILIIPGQPAPEPEEPENPPEEAQPTAPVDGAEVSVESVIGAGDLNTERVLLKRAGSGELSLAGWQLLEEDGQVFTFPRLTLFEDGAVNVHTRSGQATVVDLYWGLDVPVWETGETVVLLDDLGEVRATYRVP